MTAPTRYPIPAATHRVEEEIRHSRFITTLGICGDAAQAQDFIESVRREFPDATHHCWAFVGGPPGTTAQVGLSDDGEPHGTAGRPMLNVLLHAAVGEIVAVVTRFYGGVKLGKGGLSRAYAGGVKKALANLPLKRKIAYRSAKIMLDYSHVTGFRQLTEKWEAELAGEDYALDASFSLRVPQDCALAFERDLATLTGGGAILTWQD